MILIEFLRTLFLDLLARIGFPFFPPFPGPRPKIPSQCNFARFYVPETIPDRPRVLAATDTRGTIVASEITLPAGRSIEVSGDLVLIAKGDIRIEGRITRPEGPHNRLTRHIAIVSLEGTVYLGSGVVVGGGTAFSSPDLMPRGFFLFRSPFVIGAPGFPGSVTLIRGKVIELDGGDVVGERGGKGGSANLSRLHRYHGGIAYGGWGGFGGDVALCAEELIAIKARSFVLGGEGGQGGDAAARVGPHGAAQARGGPGNTAGDVIVTGTSPQGKCLVTIERDWPQEGLFGNQGGKGGDASASHWPIVALPGQQQLGPSPGGLAQAFGGAGGKGSTVIFVNSHVSAAERGRIRSGDGRRAGNAEAFGGDGGTRRDGLPGGFALALGGFGGSAGTAPAVPLDDGSTVTGEAGDHAPGGNAEAQGGRGGDGAVPFQSNGGSSGAAFAHGGLHGDGMRDAIPAIARPVEPVPGVGGGLEGPPARSPAPP